MAAKTRSDIIGDIEDYIAKNGGNFAEWYVGVTGNPKHTLFTRHALKPKGDAWISRLAKDEYEAHEVGEYFRTIRHTRGSAADPGASDIYVYGYKLKSHTKP
ncbi:MAG: hypothetical protein HY985_18015 [Magnetospirillum sp.]|nr:hypothetical protein [Magnetospirillum sp.]